MPESTDLLTEEVERLRRKVCDLEALEQAARESEERFRGVFEHTNSGVAVYEAVDDGDDFVFLDFNARAEEIEGTHREGMIGRRLTDVFPGVVEFGLLDVIRRVWRTGEPAHHPIKMYADDRIQGWRENFVYRLSNGEVVAVYEDITERKRAEEQRLILERQVQQAQKMESLGVLAGGIAHDFNNILGAQIGFNELAKGIIPAGSEAQNYLAEIEKASLRARDLVSQILDFSRQGEQEQEPIVLQRVIEEAMSLLRKAVPSTIDFECDVGTGKTLVVADATQIHRVAMNLGTNAYHAMRERGGTLTVRLDVKQIVDEAVTDLEEGLYARLSVSDTGHGMTQDTIARIFEPYYTTKAVQDGTGLGLAMVLGIVQKTGGSITVESRLGEGSTFDVYLPVYARIPGSVSSGGG
jgi:PAS domain S-box-containing protein